MPCAFIYLFIFPCLKKTIKNLLLLEKQKKNNYNIFPASSSYVICISLHQVRYNRFKVILTGVKAKNNVVKKDEIPIHLYPGLTHQPIKVRDDGGRSDLKS